MVYDAVKERESSIYISSLTDDEGVSWIHKLPVSRNLADVRTRVIHTYTWHGTQVTESKIG